MANLDDFFKKKDIKKTKTKKFAVNNPLFSNFDDHVKNEAKQEMPTSLDSTLSTNKNDLFSSQTFDEWRDYVEEEKKDYSGLKIQNLQISDSDTDRQNSKQTDSEEESKINEQGETIVKKNFGPWKKLQEQKKEEIKLTPVHEKAATPLPKKVENDVYSIPHHRNNNNFREDQNKARHNAKKTPSDLSSEELFPALGATVSRAGRQYVK